MASVMEGPPPLTRPSPPKGCSPEDPRGEGPKTPRPASAATSFRSRCSSRPEQNQEGLLEMHLEHIAQMLSFLDYPEIVKEVPKVCRLFHTAAEHDLLWDSVISIRLPRAYTDILRQREERMEQKKSKQIKRFQSANAFYDHTSVTRPAIVLSESKSVPREREVSEPLPAKPSTQNPNPAAPSDTASTAVSPTRKQLDNSPISPPNQQNSNESTAPNGIPHSKSEAKCVTFRCASSRITASSLMFSNDSQANESLETPTSPLNSKNDTQLPLPQGGGRASVVQRSGQANKLKATRTHGFLSTEQGLSRSPSISNPRDKDRDREGLELSQELVQWSGSGGFDDFLASADAVSERAREDVKWYRGMSRFRETTEHPPFKWEYLRYKMGKLENALTLQTHIVELNEWQLQEREAALSKPPLVEAEEGVRKQHEKEIGELRDRLTNSRDLCDKLREATTEIDWAMRGIRRRHRW
uniref:F-box domain-containing protein n=1 Tax=Chromera velia CCMP2878 TaxID=1169474 RepID=A0A0G4F0Y7_9ALVE|eukprot:Cvel_14566.t1-p1 / transcript=Cvel_14566.t1 / gene=Cvel_14566 / organism=Chromera_velia_CCMP2878 / gene_product=hypothetical protein / transcript_product=hypothetical protein / location=Cvel_scaffold1041:13568-15855(+) / protein_length=469 / sequence_SO=supercontig / SO=protein_coding / is_pseudo=false